MASLRALLGVVLCSLMVSASEILPQADFDLQWIAVMGYVTEMRVVDGKPDEYGLNHYINTGRSETSRGFTGRSLDLSAEVKFNQLCLQTGILPHTFHVSFYRGVSA